ncbi:hypothetical protein T10_5718 [Trichinella papuae]|uniref:Uncharacterized protein n=1 Tax=Trichinella papuae TaxID=268474 RepID=A0A0V1MY98_9BILA|nr:hypothetical protein T10_7586 [Trichinella papuae]KRZ76560.1 hypothetical protein T10_5718 [Trichinella papuae]
MVTSNSDTPKEKRRCSVMCRLSKAEQIHRATCLPDIDSFSSGVLSPFTLNSITCGWFSSSWLRIRHSRTGSRKQHTSILLYKNVPCQEGASPAMLALNRPIQDCLPMHETTFTVEWRWEVSAQEQQKKGKRKASVLLQPAHTRTDTTENQRSSLSTAPDHQEMVNAGVMRQVGPNRDYIIRTTSGMTYR